MAPGHRHPEVVRAENDRCHVPRVGVAVLDSPEGFFTTAVDLDGRIREAAQVFDASLDGEAVTIDPAVAPGLEALGATPRRYLIPAGLAPDLEMAVRAGFTDPDGRISALQGGHREIGLGGNPEYGPDRLANGGTSADRLAGDPRCSGSRSDVAEAGCPAGLTRCRGPAGEAGGHPVDGPGMRLVRGRPVRLHDAGRLGGPDRPRRRVLRDRDLRLLGAFGSFDRYSIQSVSVAFATC